jgi:hypothetical protein
MQQYANTDIAIASPELRARVRARIDEIGMTAASRELGIARGTIASIVAGLRVQPGTLALVAQKTAART